MKMIRTTISLPGDLHHQLRSKAFRYHKSLNQVIIEQLRETPEHGYVTKSMEQRIQEDLEFFNKIAGQGQPIQATQAVRSERDRDEF